jgi:DNA-binding NarL/FixJ family response regulator
MAMHKRPLFDTKYLKNDVTPAVTSMVCSKGGAVFDEALTVRQREVLQYLARGYRPCAIAALMALDCLTIRDHIRRGCERLQANTPEHAIAIAITRGLIVLDDTAA